MDRVESERTHDASPQPIKEGSRGWDQQHESTGMTDSRAVYPEVFGMVVPSIAHA